MRVLFGHWPATVLLMLALGGLGAGPVLAQSKSQNSTAAAQKAMDELVDALSTAVAEKLKKDAGSSSKTAQPAAASEPAEPSEQVRDPIKDFATRAEVALSGYPELWRTLARVPVVLDESASGGRDLGGGARIRIRGAIGFRQCSPSARAPHGRGPAILALDPRCAGVGSPP
jgi:hypothetical protein